MKDNFDVITPEQIDGNVFKTIGTDWMLITAGTMEDFNTMTASWGTMGILWNRPIAVCFVRPQRYTFEFTEKNEIFTLSFFPEEYRDVLRFCGAKSGRDYDKTEETGLLPLETGNKGISFHQARLILECEKVYADYLKEEKFLLSGIADKVYPNKDFHKFYIGHILQAYRIKDQM